MSRLHPPRRFPLRVPATDIRLSALVAALCLVFGSLSANGGEWTQWRGPQRDGQVPTLPESLSNLTLAWSVDLPPSYSGPVADGERIYTTATEGKSTEVVVAYNRGDGSEAWRASWPGAMSVPFFAAANGSWIRATPALADGRLFVAGMRDVLVCLNAASGEELWRKDFTSALSTDVPMFGNVCSPLVVGDLVVVQSANSVVALDVASGDVRWRSLNETESAGRSEGAFSSPLLDEDAPGGPQLLVQTRSTLAGLEPKTGRVLWQTPVEAFRGMNILTPLPRTVGDELQVFTSSYGGGSSLFVVRGDEVTTKWTNRAEAYMASPVSVGDRLIVPLKNQRTTALDWETGETIWRSTPYGKYWSMLTDGTQVVALDQKGQLYRLDVSGKTMEILEEREVSPSETWAYLGWDGSQLMIRRLDGLDVYTP